MIPLTSGNILVKGKAIAEYSQKEVAKTIAFLPQNRNVPEITVEQLVLHGRFPYLSYPRSYRPCDHEIVDACIEKMGLTDIRTKPLPTLSGGTRQKVYLAMALAQDTEIILMDEPTTFLDISHQFQVMEQARILAQEGKTVVMVLHDLSAALRNAHQIAVMDEGTVSAYGNADTVYQTGCLDQAFRIHLGRYQANGSWQYYYERGE